MELKMPTPEQAILPIEALVPDGKPHQMTGRAAHPLTMPILRHLPIRRRIAIGTSTPLPRPAINSLSSFDS
jgi:hypothetical protein